MSNPIALPSGTELVGDYRIERVLGTGGFGITYLADEIALDRAVTIKEYFPADFAARGSSREAVPRSHDCSSDYRWGLDRFIEEAQILARFDHPNIVRVYRYFRANNTGYMVLKWEEGKSLKTWLQELKRAPNQDELDEIIAPLLDALEMIHAADFLHRDIAPDNIIVRKSGAPVLIDFGSARGEIAAHSKVVSALVKPGYSPYEQYAETSRQQGPWTDIYALGATLYHAVTGKRPPDAPSRVMHDEYVSAREAAKAGYRDGFLRAIDRALSLEIKERPQSVLQWRRELLAIDATPQGWLAKAREKKRGQETTRRDAGVAEVAAEVVHAAGASPPPPDVPGPKGSLLDYLDRIGEPPPVAASAAPVASGAMQPEPVAAKKPRASTRRTSKAKPGDGKQPQSAAAPVAAAVTPGKAPAVGLTDTPIAPAAPRRLPRLFQRQATPRSQSPKTSRRLVRPWLVKLAIGACVASAAVMLQNRLPSIVASMNAAPNGIVTGSTTVTPQIASISAHDGGVHALQYSADGAYLYSTGADATVKVWRASQLEHLRTIPLDSGAARTLAVRGGVALTGHSNGQVSAWDLATARKRASYRRNEADVWSLTFTGDDSHFLTATHDWKVTLWDAAQDGTPIHVFDGHDNAVQAIAYASNSALFASGGADRTVRLWNLTTFELVRTYRGAKDFITSITLSPDGKLIAAASLDGVIRVWSTTSQRQQARFLGHRGGINQVAFAPDSQRLVSAGSDGTVRLWDIERRRAVRAYTGHEGEVKAATFAPDGARVATAGADGTVRIWIGKPTANAGS